MVVATVVGLSVVSSGCTDDPPKTAADTSPDVEDTSRADTFEPDTTPDTDPDVVPDVIPDVIPEPPPLPDPNALYAGRSLTEWGASWWRWYYGLPAEGHPFLDLSGDDCGAGQGGSVFFLPGLLDAYASRVCQVPAGMHVLVPMAYDNAGIAPVEYLSERELKEEIETYVDSVDSARLYVDEHVWTLADMRPYRVAPSAFVYELPETDNMLEYLDYLPEVGPVDSFHGGYYVMLEPLAPGRHTLSFSVSDLYGPFENRFTLEVYEPTAQVTSASPVRDPSLTTAGKTLPEWGEAWVRWFFDVPWRVHPARELSSWHCVQNQDEDAFFLVGTDGASSCNVPAGKPIVFPLLNAFYDTCGYSAEDIAAQSSLAGEYCRAVTDAARDLVVELDGAPIFTSPDGYSAGGFRSGLRAFPIEVSQADSVIAAWFENPYVGTCEPTWMDGLYVVLDALEPGTHELRFAGHVRLPEYLGGEPFVVDTSYELVVAPAVALTTPNVPLYGKTPSEWSAAWWQWVYGLPATDHPLLDPTGTHCGKGQTGDVFFLGGTFGGAAERHCSVPAGKALLVPLVAAAFDNAGRGAEQVDDEVLRTELQDYLTSVRDLSLQIDAKVYGHQVLERFIAPTTHFTYTVPAEDSLHKHWGFEPPIGSIKGFTGGYYVVLEPLPPGLHHVRVSGRVANKPEDPDDDIVVDVLYHLQIEAPL